MTTLPWYSDQEIDSMCDGLASNAAKVRHLRRQGLTVSRKPNGRPLLMRSNYERVMGLIPEPIKQDEPATTQTIEHVQFQETPLGRWQEMRRQNVQRAIDQRGEVVPPSKAEIKAAKALQARRMKEARAAVVRFHAARRRVIKLQRTPRWANQEAIRRIYQEAARLSFETGVMHHVDHIIPLQGTIVSGLHVEDNLRVITATENMIKRNRYEVDTTEKERAV